MPLLFNFLFTSFIPRELICFPITEGCILAYSSTSSCPPTASSTSCPPASSPSSPWPPCSYRRCSGRWEGNSGLMADSSCLVVVAGDWGLSTSSAAKHHFNLEEARRQQVQYILSHELLLLETSNSIYFAFSR